MFDIGSRYYNIDTVTYTSQDGRSVIHKKRRFLPRGETLATLAEITVVDGERLDLIAGRTLGNPEHFWRVCDAENAMNPPELTEAAGRVLRVPVPQVT